MPWYTVGSVGASFEKTQASVGSAAHLFGALWASSLQQASNCSGMTRMSRTTGARRLIAFVIDAAIFTVVLAIIAIVVSVPFIIGLSFPSTTLGAFPAWWTAWWGLSLGGLIPVVVFLYFFLAEGLYGRTLGKEIMGLQVQRVDGKPMDMRSSLIRNISKISWVLLLIDVAVGLGTHGEMSQKWSDRYVGTKVEEKTRVTIIP